MNNLSVIIDKNAEKSVFSELDELGVKYYKSFDMKKLYEPVNTHPDMQIHFAGKNIAFVAPSAYEYYRSILPKNVELQKGNNDPGETYPSDCAYNIAVIGKYVICRLKSAEKNIIDYYADNGYEFIDVKQGYAKCNICIVGENSAITEDENIYHNLIKAGIDTLKIPVGEISLKNYDYGFIGGASGFISENKIAFIGNFSAADYYDELFNFIKNKGKDIIFLSSVKPSDYGSMLFF